MGATQEPTFPGGGRDGGRKQNPKSETGPQDTRSGRYTDPESSFRSPGGAATVRRTGPQALAPDDKNGPAPRNRGHRS